MHTTEQAPADVSADSWAAGLEAWARGRWSERMIPVDRTMQFAPQGTERPRSFHEVPVVIVVMTRATERLHRALLRSVELLRESTYGFRAVLFTDDARIVAAADVDWTFEHTFSEVDWAQISAENWLSAASEHLSWAQLQYGASLVLAPQTPDQVRADVARLGAAFLAADKVRRTAATVVEEELEGLDETQDISSRRTTSARGWWSGLALGRSTVRMAPSAGARIRLVIDRAEHPQGLLIGPAGREVDDFLAAGRAQGLSTVAFEVEEGSDAAVVQAGLETAIRAAVETLGVPGPALFAATATSNPDRAADRGLDGVIRVAGDAGPHALTMSYGAGLEFEADRTSEVLRRLVRIHRAQAGPLSG